LRQRRRQDFGSSSGVWRRVGIQPSAESPSLTHAMGRAFNEFAKLKEALRSVSAELESPTWRSYPPGNADR
jgi:hypothetical protein